MIEISIIVPVLNEQAQINPLIQHLETFAHQYRLEVIVVDGDRQGSTIQQIHKPKPWVFTTIAPAGRSRQMNHGGKQARGNVLVFLHGDTRLPQNSLHHIQETLENPNIQGGAHDLNIASQNPILGWISRIASWRSRLTRIPYGDQVIFVRRSLFEALGGYPDIPIMEDIAFMKKLKQKQVSIHIIQDPVLISDRRWQKEGILFTTLRNWTLVILYELGVNPNRLEAWYKPNQ